MFFLVCSTFLFFNILSFAHNQIIHIGEGDLPPAPLSQHIAIEDLENPCIICLNKIKPGETFVKLGCNHYYHHHCISQWSTHSRLCPICKQSMI